MKIRQEVMDVTPDIAKQWLRLSKGNRSIRTELVAAFANLMKTCRWLVNNNAITFDKFGVLIDGHHRLLAVIDSGMTVKMSVIWGVETKARETIDTGTARTLADHLMFRNVANASRVGSYINAVARILTGTPITIKSVPLFNDWLSIVYTGLEAYTETGCVLDSAKHMRAAKNAAPFILAYKSDPVKLRQFFLDVKDGANLTPGNPALTLRAYLYSNIDRSRRLRMDGPEETASKIFACALATLEGRSLSKLQASDTANKYFKTPYLTGKAAKLVKTAKEMRNGARWLTKELDFTPGEAMKETAEILGSLEFDTDKAEGL